MSTLSQFGGSQPTRAIVNFYSSGVVQSNYSVATSGALGGSREVLSGALTANTLKTILSVTNSGQCQLLSAYSKNATSRTVRLVVKVDGSTVFDATSSALVNAGRGLVAAGAAGYDGSTPYYIAQGGNPIRWNSTLEVQIASSLTETDNVAIAYAIS